MKQNKLGEMTVSASEFNEFSAWYKANPQHHKLTFNEAAGIFLGYMKDLEILREKVLVDVNSERNSQNKKWGIQRHDYGKWLGILGEEFGEVCQAINRIHFPIDAKETDASDLYSELIQLAAVACAIAEQVREQNGQT